jgi:regulation of enolase protein 1 (concanavalin A-like superfamily)
MICMVSISDQAALFLHIDAKTWIKTGIEYENGVAWASVVVTNGRYSDW